MATTAATTGAHESILAKGWDTTDVDDLITPIEATSQFSVITGKAKDGLYYNPVKKKWVQLHVIERILRAIVSCFCCFVQSIEHRCLAKTLQGRIAAIDHAFSSQALLIANFKMIHATKPQFIYSAKADFEDHTIPPLAALFGPAIRKSQDFANELIKTMYRTIYVETDAKGNMEGIVKDSGNILLGKDKTKDGFFTLHVVTLDARTKPKIIPVTFKPEATFRELKSFLSLDEHNDIDDDEPLKLTRHNSEVPSDDEPVVKALESLSGNAPAFQGVVQAATSVENSTQPIFKRLDKRPTGPKNGFALQVVAMSSDGKPLEGKGNRMTISYGLHESVEVVRSRVLENLNDHTLDCTLSFNGNVIESNNPTLFSDYSLCKGKIHLTIKPKPEKPKADTKPRAANQCFKSEAYDRNGTGDQITVIRFANEGDRPDQVDLDFDPEETVGSFRTKVKGQLKEECEFSLLSNGKILDSDGKTFKEYSITKNSVIYVRILPAATAT